METGHGATTGAPTDERVGNGQRLAYTTAPPLYSTLGSICCDGGTPVHIGAITRYIVPLCASQSRQSGLGLPPSRDDVPKSDRLLVPASGHKSTLRDSGSVSPSGNGAAIYASDCASCHGFDAKGFASYLPALSGNPVVLDENPSSLINVVLNGSVPLVANGSPDAYRMPQFRQQLSDQDAADVITFMRNRWGNQAPAVTVAQVAKLRKTTNPTSDQVIILKMR